MLPADRNIPPMCKDEALILALLNFLPVLSLGTIADALL